MLAALLDVEELALEESEAKRLNEAVRDVAKHYTVLIEPKKLALLNLGATCIGIYGTRAIAWRARVKKERMARLEVMPGGRDKSEPAPAAAPAGFAGARTPRDLWPAGV